MKNLFYFFFLFLIACQSNVQDTQDASSSSKSNSAEIQQPKLPQFNRYYEDENETLSFFVQAVNGEKSYYRIRTRGLNKEIDYQLNVKGVVTEGHLLDLDVDGFNELYLVYRFTDGSENLGLWGIASNRNERAFIVEVNDSSLSRQKGSDRVFQADGKLSRSFNTKDGSPVTFSYELKIIDGKYILNAKQND
jgi:hypothetical protein